MNTPARPDDPGSMVERNRVILAQRLGWPDGAVEACREIERACPGYSVWYGTGDVRENMPPHYSARKHDARYRDPTYRGETPAAVVAKIQAEHRT